MISKKDQVALPPSEAAPTALQLSHVRQGRRVRLVSCDCGGGMTARIESMGIRLGAEFDVVKASTWGPMVIGLGNSRFALGKSMTRRMLVALIEPS